MQHCQLKLVTRFQMQFEKLEMFANLVKIANPMKTEIEATTVLTKVPEIRYPVFPVNCGLRFLSTINISKNK
jgi:hypothetical protein